MQLTQKQKTIWDLVNEEPGITIAELHRKLEALHQYRGWRDPRGYANTHAAVSRMLRCGLLTQRDGAGNSRMLATATPPEQCKRPQRRRQAAETAYVAVGNSALGVPLTATKLAKVAMRICDVEGEDAPFRPLRSRDGKKLGEINAAGWHLITIET